MKQKHIRTTIELLGLVFLVLLIAREHGVLLHALDQIKKSNVALFVAACALFWATYVWSAIGYLVLAKKARLSDIVLVNIAASGPGKIIPGGAGFMSFGALYLKKRGYRLEQGLAIATANNIIGFLINCAVLFFIGTTQAGIFTGLHISAPSTSVLFGVFIISVLLLLLVRFVPQIKKTAVSFVKDFQKTISKLLTEPRKLVTISVATLGVLTTNAAVLYIAGHSVSMPIGYAQAVVGMSIGVAAGSILPTPGGVGGVEAGLIAALVFLGFDVTAATATALLYRAATYVQPFIPGCIAYLYLRKRKLI